MTSRNSIAIVLIAFLAPVIFSAGYNQAEKQPLDQPKKPKDAQEIIERSVQAGNRDWAALPQFDCSERDRNADGSKTYEDLMIDGSDYQRLVAVNGKPLSPAKQAEQARKLKEETDKRQKESPQEREQRIAKYEAQRRRDHALLTELSKAFQFNLVREQALDGHRVYVLQAKPRPGYKPPNRDTEVLTGMTGTLWIDKDTFQWVRVRAQVVHPVTIEGFLARVEPGTQFELDKMPVSRDVWLPTRFSVTSRAKVLFLFHHGKWEEDSYFNYRSAGSSASKPG